MGLKIPKEAAIEPLLGNRSFHIQFRGWTVGMMGTLEGKMRWVPFREFIRNISNSRQCDDRFFMIGGLPYISV
jgi:hypothetical protein